MSDGKKRSSSRIALTILVGLLGPEIGRAARHVAASIPQDSRLRSQTTQRIIGVLSHAVLKPAARNAGGTERAVLRAADKFATRLSLRLSKD